MKMAYRLAARGVRSGSWAGLAACAAASLWSAPAWGQPDSLPDAVVTDASLSSSERSRVRSYAEEALELLSSEEAGAVDRAAAAFMEPFYRREAASIGFRLAFSAAAAGELRGLATADDVHRAVVANLAAGVLGTEDTLAALELGLGDERPGVRAAAASGLRTVVLTAAADAVRRPQAERSLELAAAGLVVEGDATAARALVAALAAGRGEPEVSREGVLALARSLPAVRENAELATFGLDAESSASASAWSRVFRSSLDAMFGRLIEARSGGAFGPEAVRATARGAGEALRYVVSRLEASADAGEEPAEAEGLRAVVVAGARVIDLAGQSLGTGGLGRGIESAFEGALESGRPAELGEAVERAMSGLE